MAKFLVVGLGGVGVITAYTLTRAKQEVTVVIRSDYDTVVEKGYEIDSTDYGHIESWRPSHIARSVKEAMSLNGPFDYVVTCTKNVPDVFNPEDIYADAVLDTNPVIVLIQNGMGIEKPVFKRFPGNIVLSGVSMISSANFGGVIKHTGQDSLALGYFDNGISSKEEQLGKAQEFISIYGNELNECYLDKDVKYTRWRKLIYNASFNTIGAVVDLDVGRLQDFGGDATLLEPAMDEIIAIARSDGVQLDPGLKEFMKRSDDGEWYAPSMVVDVRKGNQIEVEVILKTALDIARENGVAAPTLSVVYHMLKLIQMKLKEQNGRIVMPAKRPVGEDEEELKRMLR